MTQVGSGSNDIDNLTYSLYYDSKNKQHYLETQYSVMTDNGPGYETDIVPVSGKPTVSVSVSDAADRLNALGIDIADEDVEAMATYHKKYVRDVLYDCLREENHVHVYGTRVAVELQEPHPNYLSDAPVEFGEHVEAFEVFRAFSPEKRRMFPHCEFYGNLEEIVP